MQADDVLASLKTRFAGQKTRHITVTADEIDDWPDGFFDRLLSAKLLAPTDPAQSLECPGCERACPMPVTLIAAEGGRPARAFIACDKPENYGRIKITFAKLRQWRMTRESFDKVRRDWIATPAAGTARIRKTKAPVAFRNALEKLLAEIEKRAKGQMQQFDRHAMPGRKVDFHEVARKFDAALDDLAVRTFDDYLDGLCAFKRGARKTTFYRNLFNEYF